MKKLILILPLLFGCGSTQTPQQYTSHKEAHTLSLEQQEKLFRQDQVKKEESTYEQSVQDIQDKFRSEYGIYQKCLYEQPKNTCDGILKKFCVVDVHLDAHGNHYKKPYCNLGY